MFLDNVLSPAEKADKERRMAFQEALLNEFFKKIGIKN